MKKFLSVLSTALLLFAGCSDEYDDTALNGRMDDLENRVAKLEELCKQMNTNISSLQTIVTALQNNDYVTGVVPVTKEGETIGYTISFTKSLPVTIYHGQNGKDGADGKDGANGADGKDGQNGHTPVIGVRQDTDGIYYWTLDGNWLLDDSSNKIKAEGCDGQNGKDGVNGTDGINGSDGKDGKDGQDGVNGSDGKDGADGKDGKDGITPQLKIEGGYWYVSTDNGTTWTNLGKATGENGADGKDGQDGNPGDSIFRSVTQDDESVYFTLTDDTVIAIAKYKGFTIAFSQQTDIPVGYGKPATVAYTINGGGPHPMLEIMNADEWIVEIAAETASTGSIVVISPQIQPKTDKIVVLVSDGQGRTTMAALTFAYEANDSTAELPIPDPNFKRYLLSVADMDRDGLLTPSDAEAWNRSTSVSRKFDVSKMEIRTLEGIEYFTALEELNCSQNDLTTLDVSRNTTLIHLYCSRNKQLSSLNVSGNKALKRLSFGSCPLTSIDLSGCPALNYLYCCDTRLDVLDLSSNPELDYVACVDNPLLQALDCSNNSKLTRLDMHRCSNLQQLSVNAGLDYLCCNSCGLRYLDLSNCTKLTYLSCYDNQLKTLDLSNCTALTELFCSGNRLTSLDLSRNPALKHLSYGNNLLSDVEIANKAALKFLDCSYTLLTSLETSIYPSLQSLNCSNNRLTSLDVSRNPDLTSLNCSNNRLTGLNVDANPALQELNCSENLLASLDISRNPDLTSLDCSNNRLMSLNVDANPVLQKLYCSKNLLTELDISKTAIGNEQTNLIRLQCVMPTLSVLYLRTGWAIKGINVNRKSFYISDLTEIRYKE